MYLLIFPHTPQGIYFKQILLSLSLVVKFGQLFQKLLNTHDHVQCIDKLHIINRKTKKRETRVLLASLSMVQAKKFQLLKHRTLLSLDTFQHLSLRGSKCHSPLFNSAPLTEPLRLPYFPTSHAHVKLASYGTKRNLERTLNQQD